ncbi:MAG: riboflavin synthase [Deltaproteobacteria bacterium]|nr:riboflavin synthase [Deltaproteobacteria bacterium]
MFTGIIEEIGIVDHSRLERGAGSLGVRARRILENCRLGDSIAVNGVCLTVTKMVNDLIFFDVSPETMQRTNLGALSRGSQVNLERAMAADGRFGGHLVSGHIDGTGTITARQPQANAVLFTFSVPPDISRYLVEKGSIAIDGISLTTIACEPERFSAAIIPHTLQHTTLAAKSAGATVNLEVDMIAKYVYTFLGRQAGEKPAGTDGVNLDFLRRHGFA